MKTVHYLLYAIAALLIAFGTANTTKAQALKPFVGYWTGIASLEVSPGKHESMKCLFKGTMPSGALGITIHCASASVKIRIVADVQESAGSLRGSWKEVGSYNIEGTLSGSVGMGVIKGRISSPNFTAAVDIAKLANGLRVALTPSNGSMRFSVAMR